MCWYRSSPAITKRNWSKCGQTWRPREAGSVKPALNSRLTSAAAVTLGQASIETAAAEVKRSEAAVRQAELDLSYTQVKVQESGYVTRKTIEAGAYVQPGQALLAIVPRDFWVVANFKETQLTQMRPGK